MDHEAWLKRWREGEIGFHRDQVNVHLEAHGRELFGPAGSRVLVPLCGKSLDLLWLEKQGYAVTGVELAPLAIESFHRDHGRQPERSERGPFQSFRSGGIEILQGDVFALPGAGLPPFDGVHDRAAFIALPPEVWPRYSELLLDALRPGGHLLLVVISYEEGSLEGPPFSVPPERMEGLFGSRASIDLLHDEDIQEKDEKLRERGARGLRETVYRLVRER